MQPEHAMDGRTDRRQAETNSLSSKMVAVVLMLLGIILYVFILYVIVSSLVFPGSLSPFMAPPDLPETANVTAEEQLKGSILKDVCLLCLFVVQHSFMASNAMKSIFSYLSLSTTSRLLYIFSTCVVIQFIYTFWESTPSYTLWSCDSCTLHYGLVALHVVGWISIACSVFAIDYLELLGIKQIYYAYRGFRNPMAYKSAEQQQLLHHLRHPIFIAPNFILWAIPTMTYDRLLVAVMLPLYLAWGSRIDYLDDKYVREQFQMKKSQLLKND